MPAPIQCREGDNRSGAIALPTGLCHLWAGVACGRCKGGAGKSFFLMPAQDAQVVAEEANEVFGTAADWIEV